MPPWSPAPRRLLACLLAAPVAACAPRVGPESFGAAITPLAPPAAYAVWYEELRRCVGAGGSFSDIRWYRARPGAELLDLRTGEVLAGFWTERHDAIILAARSVNDPAVVKHELLHHLRRAGNQRDPAFQPGNRCGVAPARVPPPAFAATPEPDAPGPGARIPP